MHNKLSKDVRCEQILSAAMTIAKRDGFAALSRDGVAREAGCGAGTVNCHYNTMQQLRRAVIRHAVKEAANSTDDKQLLAIVAQGLMSGESSAKKAPDNIKTAALATLM